MRILRTRHLAVLLGLAMPLAGCSGVVGLAHGDPGRESADSARRAVAAAPAEASATSATEATLPAAKAVPAVPALRRPVGTVSAVVVTFTDAAQQQAASDPRLSPDAIAQAVERELTAHRLYAPTADPPHTLAISIRDFSTALASNASLLGYTFRNVVLIGEVQASGAAAPGTVAFEVHARARTSTRESGSAAGSLEALYTRFAQLTVADLLGISAPEEPIPR